MTKRIGRGIAGLAVAAGMFMSIGAVLDKSDVPDTRIAMSSPTEKVGDVVMQDLHQDLRPR